LFLIAFFESHAVENSTTTGFEKNNFSSELQISNALSAIFFQFTFGIFVFEILFGASNFQLKISQFSFVIFVSFWRVAEYFDQVSCILI